MRFEKLSKDFKFNGKSKETDENKMNKLLKSALGASIRSFIALFIFTAAAHFAHGANGSPATLRGEAAIERLKQTGQYNGLLKALDNSRVEDERRTAPAKGDRDSTSFLALNGTQEARKAASDGAANDQLGYSIALSGSTAIVGAWLGDVGANVNQGAAYVFVRSGTTWSQQAKLVASNGAADDQFGFSVAISGDTAIIGARSKTNGSSLGGQGAAYIFVRSGTVWSQQQQLTASDASQSDNFGISVGIDGNTVIIGACYDDITAGNQGSAYIFTRSGTVWSQQAKIFAPDAADQDNFGWSVSVSGDTVIAGAHQDAVGSNNNQGSAYIFTRSGTNWSFQQKLTAADGGANNYFGYSVAAGGNTVIIGAYLNNSAYVFVRSGTTWSLQQKLSAGPSGNLFGNSVSISGDTVAIAAVAESTLTTTSQGAAYVFTRSGTVWTQQTRLVALDGADFDNFGKSVAVSGDKVVAGANLSDRANSAPLADSDDFAPQAGDQGGAYFFLLTPTTAANVSVSGRVTTAAGRGIRNARVSLVLANGEVRSVLSGAFGYYRFSDLEVGQTYVLSIAAKRFIFSSPTRIVSLNDELIGEDFIADGS